MLSQSGGLSTVKTAQHGQNRQPPGANPACQDGGTCGKIEVDGFLPRPAPACRNPGKDFPRDFRPALTACPTRARTDPPKPELMKAILNFSLIPLLLHALTSQAAVTVTNISAGFAYSLFLKSDGSLWAMGYNFRAELGDGTFNNTNRPEQIVASGVTAIAAGTYHSLFLKSDGSLWAMGENNNGELGNGTFNNTN